VDLGVAFVAVTWGVNHAVIKRSIETLEPMVFNGIRLGVGSLVLLFVEWLSERDLRIEKRDALTVIAIGLLGHTAYQLSYIAGVNTTTAGKTAVIAALSPTLVAIIERLAGTSLYTARGWIGILSSLCGVALITLSGGTGILGDRSFGGEPLVLISTLCWAGYTVAARSLLEKYSTLKVTSLTMSAGAIPIVALSIPAFARQDWGSVDGPAWMGLAFSCCFAIVIGYVLWSWGIQRIGSGRTAIYSNLSPLAGSLAGWLALGETWTPAQLVGAVLVLSGVTQVRSGTRGRDGSGFTPTGRKAKGDAQ